MSTKPLAVSYRVVSSGGSRISFGRPIIFFQILRHKYLKTTQFINLYSRPLGGGRSSDPVKSAPGSRSPMQFSSMLHLYYYFYFRKITIIISKTLVMLFIYIKSMNPKSNSSFNFNRSG